MFTIIGVVLVAIISSLVKLVIQKRISYEVEKRVESGSPEIVGAGAVALFGLILMVIGFMNIGADFIRASVVGFFGYFVFRKIRQRGKEKEEDAPTGFTNMTMPNLCAVCGKWQSVTTKPVSVKKISRKYTFSVPVCNQCNTDIENAEKSALKAGLIGGGIFALILAFLMTAATTGGVRVIGAIIGLIFGFAAGSIFIYVPVSLISWIRGYSVTRAVSFNGKVFHFKNKDFHQRFAKLNPELVRK